jgi:Gram-negative bacterial TonB protein C-terminal
MILASQLARLLLISTLAYVPPRLATVVPPSAPFNAVVGNTVLSVAEVNEMGSVTRVNTTQGMTPFTDEVVKVVEKWHFEPAHIDGHAIASEVSVLVMFRPHAFGNAGLGGSSFGFTAPEVPKGDHPALPHFIFDPEWPIGRFIYAGVVIFELEITESGTIDWIRIVHDVQVTADYAKDAVMKWAFTPAVVNGKPAASRAIVAISFATPVVRR